MTPEEKIQSLIDAADEVTGQSSSDLTSAVQSLIDGYGVPSSRLPAEYQEVEYIESTGTQYIDLGAGSYQYTTISVDIQFTDLASTVQNFGIVNYPNNFLFGYADTKGFCSIFGNMSDFVTVGTADTNRHKMVVSCPLKQTTFDNVATITTSSSNFQTQSNILLFASWVQSTSTVDRYCYCRLYGCKFYDSAVIQRDLVPCYRKADDVVGLYDLVNNQFYTNSGTGTFTKGADV